MPISIICVYSVEDYVSAEKPIETGYVIPFGIATIATVLKEAGHQVKTLVLTPETPLVEVLGLFIKRFQPQLFCFTAVTTQFPLVSRAAEVVKKLAPSSYIALGGHFASLAPERAMACPHIDAICVGEGESAVLELASQLESGRNPRGIKNFWFKGKNPETIEKNPPAAFIQDLDGLPFLDRQLWEEWIEEPYKEPAVLIGRGCPYKCTYCCNHKLRTLSPGKYVRYRSVENVVAEIENISQNPNVTQIYLEVETISINLKYALELSKSLAYFNKKRPSPLQFKINFSITSGLLKDVRLEKLLFWFREANIVTLNVGLESGSERMRNEILCRPRYTNDDLITFCKKAKAFDIKINLYIMVGLPCESLSEFKETIRVARECEPNVIYANIFYPYPGTKLYDFALNRKFFSEDTIGYQKERRRVYLDLPDFPRHVVMKEYLLLNYNIFKGRKNIIPISLETLWLLMSIYPKFRRSYVFLTRNTKIGFLLLRAGRSFLSKYKSKF